MAFCPQCGHQLASDERFCAQCGHDATAPGAVPSQSAPPMAVPSQPPTYRPGVPAQPPLTQKKGTTRIVAAVALVVVAGAYFYNKSHSRTAPAGTQPGTPVNTPSGNTNPGLVVQQWLPVQWQNEGGTIMITGSWTNNSRATIASAVVECDQTDTGGNLVTKNDVRLNGPLAPNATDNFMRVRVGPMSPGTTNVSCTIVSVSPAG